MASSVDYSILKDNNFPKAELHCHLDGCYRLTTIIDLAEKRGVKLPASDPVLLRTKSCVTKRCEDLDEYLQIFGIMTPAFAGSKEAIDRITYEAIEDKFRDGVRYLELRAIPQYMADEDNGCTTDDVIETVLAAMKRAESNMNIHVRFILCVSINEPERALETAKLCKKYKGKGVVGFDIACSGDKDGELLKHFVEAYTYCKDNDIHRTVHAGEKGSAQEVKNAVELLFAERIGHGYKAVTDEAVYQMCKDKNIHFEVCPLSSFLTASVPTDFSKHPAIQFMNDGVNYSINTDDPGVQQTNLVDDYIIAVGSFKFTLEQLQKSNINALQSAFAEPALIQKLIQEFQSAYAILNQPSVSGCSAF